MKMTVGAAAAFALLAASSAAEAADPAIALVLGVKGSPFYQALACGAKAKAKPMANEPHSVLSPLTLCMRTSL